MNLHQFRVLSAVLRLPAPFATPDLVREAGVSAEVVRKTYQRYESFFTIVADTKPKLRSLTPTGREQIARELRETRSQLPPPPSARGPEGEPLGLAAAEHILYELVPAADADGRTMLLREARSHLQLADQERELSDEAAPSISVEVRLDALRRMLGFVEVLHRAEDALTRRAPRNDFSSVGALATALINSAAAQEFFKRSKSTSVCAGVLTLKDLRTRAPIEANQIGLAVWGLSKEPAWCKAIGYADVTWSSDEEAILTATLKDDSASRTSDRPKVVEAVRRPPALGPTTRGYPLPMWYPAPIFGVNPTVPVPPYSNYARIQLTAQPLPLCGVRSMPTIYDYVTCGDLSYGQNLNQNSGVIRAFDLDLVSRFIFGAVLVLDRHRDEPRWVTYSELLPHKDEFAYNAMLRFNQFGAPGTLPSPNNPPWQSKDGLCLWLGSGIVQIRLDPGYFINVLDDQLDLLNVTLVGEDTKVGEVWWLDFDVITGMLIDVHMRQQGSSFLIKIPSGDLAYNPDRECFILQVAPLKSAGSFAHGRVTIQSSQGTNYNSQRQ